MKIKTVRLDPVKIKKLAIPLEEVMQSLSEKDRADIQQEVQYIEILMWLKKNRRRLGMTQAELASRSKVPRATVTKIENGQRNVTLKTMLALAGAMGKKLKISWV